MPEGDTIVRAAATLHRVLAGREIVRVESAISQVRPERLTGARVTRVEARGKWLAMHFDRGLVLLSHMRMHGAWHTCPRGARWRKPRAAMRLVLATGDAEAVAFNVPVIELRTEAEIKRHPSLSRLGPDLLAANTDVAEAVARLRATGDLPIGEALLRQRALAGIGNVYKSEVLFACRLHPATPVSRLSDDDLARLVGTAASQLRLNVGSPNTATTAAAGRRTTGRLKPSDRLWAYGRAGRPCLRCGTPIKVMKMGTGARLTYWCPICQPTGRDSGVGIRDS